MREWSEALLEAVNYVGNEAKLSEIYETLEKHFPLSQDNRRDTVYGGRPAYQHAVRSFLSNLVQEGYLERLGRGHYRLTPRGADRLRDWLAASGRTLHKPFRQDSKSRMYLLKVEVEPMEEGGYFANCPELQGCHAEGDTIAEAIDNIEDVARIIIELCLEKGLPLPPELTTASEPPIVRAELTVHVAA